MPSNPRFIIDAIEAEQAGRPARALDIMADHLDDMLLANDFQAVDLVLALDPSFLSKRLMLSVLTMTHIAKHRLPHYQDFRERCRCVIEERGEMEKGLLERL